MCKFISGIITEKEILFLDGVNSHTEILEYYNIKDESNSPEFVRAELYPKNIPYIDFTHVDEWEFNIDQDFIPNWFIKEFDEKRFREKAGEFIKTMTIIGEFSLGSNNNDVKSISIPDNIIKISSYAFYSSSLTTVDIPNSVIYIGESAFSRCSELTNITIPSSVTRIGRDVFSCCTSLKNVIIPNSVTRIPGNTFFNCTSLTSITIPNSVVDIGTFAFCGCKN